MNTFSCADKRDTVEQVNHLETHEQEDVFLILKSHGVFFSQNCNGIFINMKHVEDVVIAEINEYINNLSKRKKWMSSIVQSPISDEANEVIPVSNEVHESPLVNNNNNNVPDIESQVTVPLDNETESIMRTFIANLENDRGNAHNMKNFYGKFQTAKKKYAKPCNRTDDATMTLPVVGLCKQGYLMGSGETEPSR